MKAHERLWYRSVYGLLKPHSWRAWADMDDRPLPKIPGRGNNPRPGVLDHDDFVEIQAIGNEVDDDEVGYPLWDDMVNFKYYEELDTLDRMFGCFVALMLEGDLEV